MKDGVMPTQTNDLQILHSLISAFGYACNLTSREMKVEVNVFLVLLCIYLESVNTT